MAESILQLRVQCVVFLFFKLILVYGPEMRAVRQVETSAMGSELIKMQQRPSGMLARKTEILTFAAGWGRRPGKRSLPGSR